MPATLSAPPILRITPQGGEAAIAHPSEGGKAVYVEDTVSTICPTNQARCASAPWIIRSAPL